MDVFDLLTVLILLAQACLFPLWRSTARLEATVADLKDRLDHNGETSIPSRCALHGARLEALESAARVQSAGDLH